MKERPNTTVFVPQIPSRFDRDSGIWVPTINIKPAENYGAIHVMFPPNVSGSMMAPILAGLRELLKGATEDDYLVAVGDPTIIAAASGLWLRTRNRLNMLVWDRIQKLYNLSEIVF